MKTLRTAFVVLSMLVCLLLFSTPAQAQTRHVFAVSSLINGNPPSGFLYHYTSSNDTTWSETIDFTINGHANSTVPVYSSNIASFAGGGQICVAYFSYNSQTQQMDLHVMRSTDDVNWTDSDLSATIHSNLTPDTTSGVTGFTDSSGNPRLLYVAQQKSNGIVVVAGAAWNGSSWVDDGPGGIGGAAATPASGTAITGYLFNTTSQAYYIATNGHIYEVYKPSGQGWLAEDITAASGAPLPISGSNLLGYKFNSNAPVIFFTTDGHIHQIWWNGSSFKTNDITQAAGTMPACDAPRQNGVPAPLTGYMFNNQPHVDCFDGDVIQTWWTGSQQLWNDWSQITGAPPVFYTPLAGYAISGHNTVFYLNSSTFLQLHEYLWNGSTTQDIQVQQISYTPVALATAIF